MKPFTKRLALVMGLLFTALICCGIVYIDNVKHYWQFSGGFVRLVVMTNAQASMTVDTNTLSIGFNSNNTARSFVVVGKTPATNDTGSGANAVTTGAIVLESGNGGSTFAPTTASGGLAGSITLVGGIGGSALFATTNATGGNGGSVAAAGGNGGIGSSGAATNAATGGTGGTFAFQGGGGGAPSAPATNTVGGAGGGFTLIGGIGASPSAGWARKGGNGGGVTLIGGLSGSAVRTNAGTPGNVTITGGASGAATTSPAFPQPGGLISITGGDGNTGDTNSDGGNVFITGGVPGSGAVPGNVAVGRISSGAARGGLQVGPIVTGTTATLTNLLTITAVLDFPSIAAGLVADLPVAFAGAADGDVVTVAVSIASVTNCTWMGFASNAVVYVRAANGQLVTAQDPNSGTFRIKLEKYR